MDDMGGFVFGENGIRVGTGPQIPVLGGEKNPCFSFLESLSLDEHADSLTYQARSSRHHDDLVGWCFRHDELLCVLDARKLYETRTAVIFNDMAGRSLPLGVFASAFGVPGHS
jgi:hypothetical protein